MAALTSATLETFLQRLIEFEELESHFKTILPDAPRADILPGEFRHHFEEIRRRVAGGGV